VVRQLRDLEAVVMDRLFAWDHPVTAFTLGQLFTDWNVRLTTTQVGALKTTGANMLATYVNGRKVSGNPGLCAPRATPRDRAGVPAGRATGPGARQLQLRPRREVHLTTGP
jgi:hypothetical protein